MNIFKNKIKIALGITLASGLLFTACNKDVQQFATPTTPANLGISLDSAIKSNPNDSLYYRMILRANGSGVNFVNILRNVSVSNQYTVFVADNAAMRAFLTAATGGAIPTGSPDAVYSGFLSSAFPIASAAGIVSYNIIPQRYDTSAIPNIFPNLQVGTSIQLAPTTAPFITATTYLSKRPSILRVNNIPFTTPMNVSYSNGIIHHVASIATPPQRLIWERLNTDDDLTIFKAAIMRADSGTTGTIVNALLTGPANFTVLAPNNLAMKQFISAATGGALPVGAPDANFIGFLGSNSIPTVLVRGIVVYHLFDDRSNTASSIVSVKRPGRIFTPNLPSSSTNCPTLLSSADSIGRTFPTVGFAATFTGAFVSAATVKGAGNATASNFIINPTPDNSGSYGTMPVTVPYVGKSDQHYVNGILHVIDQVLRPQ